MIFTLTNFKFKLNFRLFKFRVNLKLNLSCHWQCHCQ